MKRYRILNFDFDSRAISLEAIEESWPEERKKNHQMNQLKTVESLIKEFGSDNLDIKIRNFKDLKSKPFSVSAFHNKFLDQIRNSYTVGSYYPALTGACALGERILNHLIIILKEFYKSSPEYKKIYRKDSFDYWPLVIETLQNWNVLLPEAIDKFNELNVKRNKAIHFNPEIDNDDQQLALEAIHLIQDIVNIQFSSFGNQPWYFCVPGEMYIKKDWENHPFVIKVLLSNCLKVGFKHKILRIFPRVEVDDNYKYENIEITDEEYIRLRESK